MKEGSILGDTERTSLSSIQELYWSYYWKCQYAKGVSWKNYYLVELTTDIVCSSCCVLYKVQPEKTLKNKLSEDSETELIK